MKMLMLSRETNWRALWMETSRVLFGFIAGAFLAVDWVRGCWRCFWVVAGMSAVWAVVAIYTGILRQNLIDTAQELVNRMTKEQHEG